MEEGTEKDYTIHITDVCLGDSLFILLYET